MQIIIEKISCSDPCHAIRDALRISSNDRLRLDVFRLSAWVEVNHQTKNAVMKRVSDDDLKKVGCKNPDIYVNGKKDDRIVLTPPKTWRNEQGKSKKHITNIRARNIFGDEWPDHLNVLSLERVGYVYDQLKSSSSTSHILHDRNTSVVFVRVEPLVYVAYVCR